MSFKSVFRSLQEVFPQVDLRVLKAVAIEHSKDVDAAVEFVIFEVLPLLNKQKEVPYTLDDTQVTQETEHSHAETGMQKQDISTGHQVPEKESTCMLPESSVASEKYPSTDSISPLKVVAGKDSNVEVDELHLLLHNQEAEVVSCFNSQSNLAKCQIPAVSDHTHDGFHCKSHLSVDTSIASPSNACVNDELVSIEEPDGEASSAEPISERFQELEEIGYDVLCANAQELYGAEAKINVTTDISSVRGSFLNLSECGSPLYKANNSSFNESEDQHSESITENGSELATFGTGVISVAETPATASQSSHVVAIDFLEDLITDTKSSKKTLMSSLESATKMIEDIECLEDRARKAKEEASKAGQDIIIKAEGIREKLKNAKEANEIRAGEVYGEKSILATEARELQSRLLNLSDERDKSLSIIEEIRKTLEARLIAAEEEKAAAEQEKLEREEIAHKMLNEQEVIMEVIVQESRRLQQEAEENDKLKEFLMDRGRMVDILHGEIVAVCEDVRLFKERVGGHVPLSKSLSSTTFSQVSSSSSSSHQSSMSLERNLSSVELGEKPKVTCKELPDDDWELFDPLFS